MQSTLMQANKHWMKYTSSILSIEELFASDCTLIAYLSESATQKLYSNAYTYTIQLCIYTY